MNANNKLFIEKALLTINELLHGIDGIPDYAIELISELNDYLITIKLNYNKPRGKNEKRNIKSNN